MCNNPPATDQIEVSVFGPGVGEAIVVHIGDGKWVVVDSAIDKYGALPIQYLEKLGVVLKEDVVYVVATHWHSDHIAGLSDILASLDIS